MTNKPVMASRRDASAYNRPNTNGPKRVHVVGADGHRAACDPNVILQERQVEAERIPRQSRCQRPGCVARWPKENS